MNVTFGAANASPLIWHLKWVANSPRRTTVLVTFLKIKTWCDITRLFRVPTMKQFFIFVLLHLFATILFDVMILVFPVHVLVPPVLQNHSQTMYIFLENHTFQAAVAGLKQPGSMTGFGNAIFLYSLHVTKSGRITHRIDVVGPCPLRTVVASSNGRKNKSTS